MFSFQRKFFFGLSEGILKISCHFMLSLKETSLVALTAVAVQSLNRVWLFAIPWTAALQASLSFTVSLSLLTLMCNPTISSYAAPSSVCPQTFPVSRSFPMSQFFASGDQSIGAWVSVSDWIFQRIFRVYFLYDWMLWSPSGQRDSQESSPALQFKSINSLALSLLYGSTLTSVHDYWKNHSFGYMDLGRQSDVSDF